MKKGRIIDTNKLILRILITFLGTAGVSSVFVSVTVTYISDFPEAMYDSSESLIALYILSSTEYSLVLL